jgi:hypothetical protein
VHEENLLHGTGEANNVKRKGKIVEKANALEHVVGKDPSQGAEQVLPSRNLYNTPDYRFTGPP